MTDKETEAIWQEVYERSDKPWRTCPPTMAQCSVINSYGVHMWNDVTAEAHGWSMMLTGNPTEGRWEQCLNCRMMKKSHSEPVK